LGVYANHAIVFANLIINNKKHGIHAFLVPIRDQSHKLFPGVEAGDVGPKYGYNNKDNGYAIFTQYRIPRMNMLMRYAKVEKNGDYSRRGNEKISYATMLITRSLIPAALFFGFSKACTIITRYSLVRTQFKDSNGKEIPILNYQIQQEKVIPRIAEAFANFFGAEKIT
jgi:acyl-CoA oxidase